MKPKGGRPLTGTPQRKRDRQAGQAGGHLLLKSFRANEAVFQLMMLTYNLFLLFKIDFMWKTEYRQQIKTFRLKYIFLAGKIIRTARRVVMKLSELNIRIFEIDR